MAKTILKKGPLLNLDHILWTAFAKNPWGDTAILWQERGKMFRQKWFTFDYQNIIHLNLSIGNLSFWKGSSFYIRAYIVSNLIMTIIRFGLKWHPNKKSWNTKGYYFIHKNRNKFSYELMICNFVMDEEERERETMTGQNILRCHSVLLPNTISNPIKIGKLSRSSIN